MPGHFDIPGNDKVNKLAKQGTTKIQNNEVVSWARGYKEKHKLDSKLISDSAFRTHLSFCKNREIINLSNLKLKTSNSGSWRCYAGGGKRNENRDSIKCGKRKGGKLDGPMQCY